MCCLVGRTRLLHNWQAIFTILYTIDIPVHQGDPSFSEELYMQQLPFKYVVILNGSEILL